MKVLLTKKVKSLGDIGDIKEVKDGYGRNFLVAKGFAKIATKEVVQEWQTQQSKDQIDEKILIENLDKERKHLLDLVTVIKKKIGKGDTLFGAVTKDEIAHAIKDQHNMEIDKKHIEHKLSIKHVGEYMIDIKLGHAIHAQTKLIIQGL